MFNGSKQAILKLVCYGVSSPRCFNLLSHAVFYDSVCTRHYLNPATPPGSKCLIMASEGEPGWDVGIETVLVKRNLTASTKGKHEPRPLVTPIYNSSTYVLESAKEGEVLSMNHAKVLLSEMQLCMLKGCNRHMILGS